MHEHQVWLSVPVSFIIGSIGLRHEPVTLPVLSRIRGSDARV